MPSLRRVTPTDGLPAGYVDGWSFDAPVIDMPVYLDWLVARLAELGGTVTRLNLGGLPPSADRRRSRRRLVVDCAGLGARLLAADRHRGSGPRAGRGGPAGRPDRVVARRPTPVAPTYVVPRASEIVVGGTEEHGEWSRTPDPETARDILERATALVPALAGARVLGHRVGLRPARPSSPARARGPRRALLRARRRGRDAQLGMCGRGRPTWSGRLSQRCGMPPDVEPARDPAPGQHADDHADQWRDLVAERAADTEADAVVTRISTTSAMLTNISVRKIRPNESPRGTGASVGWRLRLRPGCGLLPRVVTGIAFTTASSGIGPYDVGKRLGRARHRRLVDDRYVEPVGVDLQEEQRLGHVARRSGHAPSATGRRGWRG